MRRAFTLIELMISISILSIIMIFLYQSYSSLNKSNEFYKKEVLHIKKEQLIKKILFLDFSLALSKSITILNQEKNQDIVFLQSSNSMHRRFNPYIAYIMKDSKLYRLESLKEFVEYPINIDAQFSVECFGEVNIFRIYESQNKNGYLIHIDFKNDEDILLKVKKLN
jgi:prepilin-type N-terminal cleavage/methylation domain-containing protein